MSGDVREDHPCPFPDEVLEAFEEMIPAEMLVIDPFAGIGRIHELPHHTIGVEIELEWASWHPDTIWGDSTQLLEIIRDRLDKIELSRDVPMAVATSPTYGNRMADQYVPPETDTSRRYTYRLSLGRSMTPGNSAAMQWGRKYRKLHFDVYVQCALLGVDMLFINVKDHVRKKERVPVSDFHTKALTKLGYELTDTRVLKTDGIKHSPNRERFPEQILQFTKRTGGSA